VCKNLFQSNLFGLLPFLIITLFGLLGLNFASINFYTFQLDSQHCFYLFFFLGLFYLLKGKEHYFILFIGLGSLFHILLAIFYFGIFILLKILSNTSIQKLCIYICIFGILTLPILIPYAFYQEPSIFTSQEFINLYIKDRHPHHYLLSNYFLGDIFYFFFSIICAMVLFKLNANKSDITRYLLLSFLVSLILLPIHFIFTELLPIKYVAILGAPRFFSHTSMIIIALSVSFIVKGFFSNIYYRNFKPVHTCLIALLFIISITYDSYSSNFSKLDYLRYDILKLQPSSDYANFIALNDACSWIQKNTNVNVRLITNFSESRWSCNRALIGGSIYPFTSNELIIQRFFKERSYSGSVLERFSEYKNLNTSEPLIFIVKNDTKNTHLSKIYSNNLISVYTNSEEGQ
jgi:hypothetical protein